MSDLKSKPDPKYKCNECDKPYVKKGAMTNHEKKVHNITRPPLKTGFMDVSSCSDTDEFKLDHDEEQDLKRAADELEL